MPIPDQPSTSYSHPDSLTAARRAFTQMQDCAARLAAEDVSPRDQRALQEVIPQLAAVVRTAALVSIAESLAALAAEAPR